jgi:hypothetical protein
VSQQRMDFCFKWHGLGALRHPTKSIQKLSCTIAVARLQGVSKCLSDVIFM